MIVFVFYYCYLPHRDYDKNNNDTKMEKAMVRRPKGNHMVPIWVGPGSIPVYTVLRKSVRFFIINIFLVKP